MLYRAGLSASLTAAMGKYLAQPDQRLNARLAGTCNLAAINSLNQARYGSLERQEFATTPEESAMTTTSNADLSGIETSGTPKIDKQAHRRNLHDAQNALSAEFQTLISDTENLLRQTSDVAGQQVQELRKKINSNLGRARELLKDSEFDLEQQGRVAVEKTEEYVQQHPWQTLGIAAGVGFLLGLLAGRR